MAEVINHTYRLKRGTAATGFIPLESEVVAYMPDGNHSYFRLKVGDGVTNVNALPFIIANIVQSTF